MFLDGKGSSRGVCPPAGRPRPPRLFRTFTGAVIFVLTTALALQVCLGAPAQSSVAREQVLEELNFRVEYLLWKEVAQARLTLTSLGNGRYLAELSSEPQGMLKTLAGPRLDSYQSEMVWKDGKFVPLIYREESRKKDKHSLKEYRFDYDRGQVELWQLKENRGLMIPKWHTALQGAINDPLSAFYNCRLGLLGPIREGETLKVNGIPYPKPEEIEVSIGPETERGRKIMISINDQAFENSRGVVFAYLDGSLVPKQAWTKVLKVGTITGELLPGGKPLNGGLPELAGRTAAPAEAGGD